MNVDEHQVEKIKDVKLEEVPAGLEVGKLECTCAAA